MRKNILILLFTCFISSAFSQTVFSESFDGTATPAGWQNTSNTGGPWVFSGSPGYSVSSATDHTGNGGNFAWIDFSSSDDSVILTTPAIDISILTTPYIDFFHESHYNSTLATFNLLHVESWDGTAWINVVTLQGNTPFGWDQYDYDVSAFTFASGDSLKIRFHAESSGLSSDFYNDLLIDDFQVMEMPSCPLPTSLGATNVTNTTADLSWIEAGSSTQWEILWGPVGTPLVAATSNITLTNPYSLTGLTSSTAYEFFVRAICGPADSSAFSGPFTFLTTCPASFSPTYSEDFTTYLNPCWSETQGFLTANSTLTGTTSVWDADGFSNSGSTGAAKINIYGITRKDWVISPSIDLGAGASQYQLEFDIALTNWNGTNTTTLGSDDTVAIVISTDNGVTWQSANALQYWTFGSEPTNTGDHIVLSLASYTGVVKFGFYAVSTATNADNDLFIDNFLVTNLATCSAPSAGTSANVTQTTADISWTENGSATNWIVEYGISGFALGAGTSQLSSTNPVTITGLNFSSTYQFYVRSICGPGDTSSHAGPSSIQTLCGPIVAPWTETFASSSLPNCWSDDGNDPWIFSTNAAYGAAVAGDYTSGGATNYAWVDGSGSGGEVDTLTTPEIDIAGLTTPHLCFAFFSNNTDDAGNNTIKVEFYDGAAWNAVLQVQQNLGPNWVPFSFDLSVYTVTGNTRVRFIVDNNSSGLPFRNDLLIDDISLNNGGCPSFCFEPTSLTATNTTPTSTDLGWSQFGSVSSWDIEWGAASFTLGTGTSVVSASNAYNLSGLNPNTIYEFYVRSICTTGDSSSWAGPFTFFTLAPPPVADLVITEIMYNPPESGSDTTEFLELYNNGASTIDLTGMYFTQGVTDTFGTDSLAPGAYYVLAINAQSFNNVYGFAPNAVWEAGALTNGGEDIILKDIYGRTVDSLDFDDNAPWPSGSGAGQADGGGASIVLCDVTSDNADAANWSASTNNTGATINALTIFASPGTANTCIIPTDVAITSVDVDTFFCNALITGSFVVSNLSTTDVVNQTYSILAGGFPVLTDTIANLAASSSDTIVLGPLPAPTGVLIISVIANPIPTDSDSTNNVSAPVTITVSNTAASVTILQTIDCNGDSTGQLLGSASNGIVSSNYTFNWSGNGISGSGDTLTNLSAGTYVLTAIDDIGCSANDTITITEPSAISITDSVQNVTCNGGNDGSATATVSGGNPNYSYLWTNGDSTDTSNNLTAGAYTVTVTDANGCVATSSSSVSEPTALVASAVDNANGSATASATGGTPTYNYQWDAAAANQTTETATGLGNGTYSVIVTDASGCTDSTSVTITGVSFGEIANLSNLDMFPNPTNGNVFVKLDLIEASNVEILIMNTIGQAVMTQTLEGIISKKVELQTGNFTAGIYTVQFIIGDAQLTRKLIIRK